MEEMVQFNGRRRDLPWVSRTPKKERARTDLCASRSGGGSTSNQEDPTASRRPVTARLCRPLSR